MIPQCFYRVSVKALIINPEKEILLCKRTDGKWDLPGGGLNFGEKPEDGLIREIQEELGLSALMLSPHPSYFLTTQDENGLWYANVLYPAHIDSLDFIPSEECTELKFFTIQQAILENATSNIKVLGKIYEQY